MDLPDDLELPLASGAAWWYWLGGRCAIDFVNTQRERWWRNVETLVTAADLALWLTQANLLEDPAEVTLPQLRAARRMRTAIDAGIQAAIDHRPPPATAIVEVNRWLVHASLPPRLECTPDGVHILGKPPRLDPVQHALARMALDAATLFVADHRDRLQSAPRRHAAPASTMPLEPRPDAGAPWTVAATPPRPDATHPARLPAAADPTRSDAELESPAAAGRFCLSYVK